VTFSAKLLPEGLEVSFKGSLADWAASTPDDLLPLASQLLGDCEAAGISSQSTTITIPNSLVAAWPEKAAVAAQLPPALPFPLDLRLTSGLGQVGTKISTRWLKVGTAISLSATPEIKGLLVEFKGQAFRLTEPYWSVLTLVEKFNHQSDDPRSQFETWAKIRRGLGDDNAAGLSDTFLRSLRVVSADAFTLTFSVDPTDGPDIVPRLMRRIYDPTGQDEADASGTATGEYALVPEDEALFVQRLDSLVEGQAVFPLRDGTFISLTPELAAQLSAVRKARRAPVEQRRQMILNPTGVLREVLAGDEGDQHPLCFIETDKYSDRVTTLAAWVPPIVPWVKIPPIDWKGSAGAEGGFRIGDKEVTLQRNEVGQAIETVRNAITAGQDTVEIAGGTRVPATEATVKALEQLERALSEPPEKDPERNQTDRRNLVLVIETNFEGEDFCRVKVKPRPGKKHLPYGLVTSPKPHQETGVSWLQEHWQQGSKGCLLADDMGLGKTYQALAFLAWVHEQMDDGVIPRKPLLVVAPVGLLANWEKEQGIHLQNGGLGEPLRAYGSWIKFLKRGSHLGGTASLDTAELSRATWVLANYEAVSEYQISFGAIEFGVVIFDEAQKIKSPATAMTSAAKALNADFVVGMTGTPVENRLADLWCIADTCQPGGLKDLKSFSQRFETNPAPETLKTLRDHLWQKEDEVAKSEPLLMLRRLKAQKLKGLPDKHEHVIRKEMPDRQRQAYRQATALNHLRGPQGTLGLIQSLRQISLHPGLFDGKGFDPADSARFLAMIEVLDKVHRAGEKALVFIESLEIQAANQLPLLLQRRYGLEQPPMVINGAVGTAERQNRVDRFQGNDGGFDLMLLSPKAGGVGLTLTAANHVVHLSRWWNPAVEDQCSDRAHRIGQTKDVHVYYPMAIDPEYPDNSFDLKLNELMSRKRDLSRSMLMPMEFGKDDYDKLISGLGLGTTRGI
jgi:hypothetical protein